MIGYKDFRRSACKGVKGCLDFYNIDYTIHSAKWSDYIYYNYANIKHIIRISNHNGAKECLNKPKFDNFIIKQRFRSIIYKSYYTKEFTHNYCWKFVNDLIIKCSETK